MTISRKKNQKTLYIIAISSLLVASMLVVFFLGKKSSDSAKKETAQNDNAKLEINPSGIDPEKNVSEVKDVEEVVAKWIEQNPMAIIKSVENMQKKAMEDRMQNAKKNIPMKKDKLFDDKESPQYAPKDYDVSVVEFYDYNCGYCKKAQATVEQLIKSDSKVRVIFKEFPILGEPSVEMAKVSIAVNISAPASFKKFHDALMKSHEKGKAGALKVAKSIGLDTKKIESTLSSQKDKIDQIIQTDITLGSEIGINGTPGFVIGEELIPGALDIEEFKKKIEQERSKKSSQ